MKISKLVGGAIAVGALLVLTACSGAPDRGYIKTKEFEPAYSSTYSSCQMIGKVMVCHPITTYHPDSWEFDLYASKWDTDKPHGWVSVDQQTYAKYHEGDFVNLK